MSPVKSLNLTPCVTVGDINNRRCISSLDTNAKAPCEGSVNCANVDRENCVTDQTCQTVTVNASEQDLQENQSLIESADSDEVSANEISVEDGRRQLPPSNTNHASDLL